MWNLKFLISHPQICYFSCVPHWHGTICWVAWDGSKATVSSHPTCPTLRTSHQQIRVNLLSKNWTPLWLLIHCPQFSTMPFTNHQEPHERPLLSPLLEWSFEKQNLVTAFSTFSSPRLSILLLIETKLPNMAYSTHHNLAPLNFPTLSSTFLTSTHIPQVLSKPEDILFSWTSVVTFQFYILTQSVLCD